MTLLERHSELGRLIHQELSLEEWAAALESGRKAGVVAWNAAPQSEKWAKSLEATCEAYELALRGKEKGK